ncbi:MAG: hypothetical protein K2H02_03310, partial [Anaeroplasmataceae bacterium]|nr:hypothetical protein [Anaeroplasmataceae bacterium]
MRLEELIKEHHLISCNFNVLKALYHSKSNRLDLELEIENALEYEKYIQLTEEMKKILEKFNPSIVIKYQNEQLSKDEYLKYLEVILKKLTVSAGNLSSLDIKSCKIEENHIQFLVPFDSLGWENLFPPVKKAFLEYGLHVEISCLKDQEKSIQAETDAIQQKIDNYLEEQQRVAKEARMINEKIQNEKKNYKKTLPQELTYIKDIP